MRDRESLCTRPRIRYAETHPGRHLAAPGALVLIGGCSVVVDPASGSVDTWADDIVGQAGAGAVEDTGAATPNEPRRAAGEREPADAEGAGCAAPRAEGWPRLLLAEDLRGLHVQSEGEGHSLGGHVALVANSEDVRPRVPRSMCRSITAAVLLLCACREPTQITLELTTDTVCADVDTTSVAAGKPAEVETGEPATVTRQCEPDGRIGSLVLVPSGGDDALIGIRAVTGIHKSAKACVRDGYRALVGEPGGCIVARRQLRFIPHTPLKLPVKMSFDCLNVPCGATLTCEGARCVSAEIEDPRECAGAEGCEIGGTDGGDGEAGVPEAGVDAALDADSAAGSCPKGLAGPALVEVSAPAGSPVSSYCVDATEVTNAQYAVFLAAKGADTSGQDTWCAWNTSYTPPIRWPVTGQDDYPVGFVDWCDAYAYCAWADKHLCGKIGGGPNAYLDYADVTKSQWFNACSTGGTHAYPYGDTYDGTACVGEDYDGVAGNLSGSDMTRTVGTANCEGGYPGLYDLSGNVVEWEDSCQVTTGTSDFCRVRGGDFANDSTHLRCDSYIGVNRGRIASGTGFRCCAAPR